MIRSGAFISLFFFTFFALYTSADSPAKQPGTREITVEAKQLDGFALDDPSRLDFGQLRFRGGLVLSSADDRFGGISAFRVEPEGSRFLALSDRGSWLTGRIIYKEGRPEGIADAVMSPVLDFAGEPADKWDTESIAQDGSRVFIGVEGIDSIMIYNRGKDGSFSRPQKLKIPPGLIRLPKNRGMEALVYVPRKFPNGGSLIAFSERGLNEAGDLKAFLVGGTRPGMFSVKRSQDYDISDVALLPSGDLLLLERRFTLAGGAAARIRRLPLKAIRPGAVVNGPVIFEADMRCHIDNMEGLSVHRSDSGEIILTIVSDDNFSIIQRTLLLQFTLVEQKS